MLKGLPGIFISNGKKGKESKTTERERVSERGRALRVEEDSIGNKIDC
jgi:hypothetical protein